MRFLAKLYPVYPREKLDVWELDCLDEEYEPSSWQDRYNSKFEILLDQYNRGIPRFNNSNLRCYNNSTWYKGEADSIIDFIDQFKEELNTDKG